MVYGKIEPPNRVICDEGYSGDSCEEKTCAMDCNMNGDCVDGVCKCHRPWTGEFCEILTCK